MIIKLLLLGIVGRKRVFNGHVLGVDSPYLRADASTKAIARRDPNESRPTLVTRLAAEAGGNAPHGRGGGGTPTAVAIHHNRARGARSLDKRYHRWRAGRSTWSPRGVPGDKSTGCWAQYPVSQSRSP